MEQHNEPGTHSGADLAAYLMSAGSGSNHANNYGQQGIVGSAAAPSFLAQPNQFSQTGGTAAAAAAAVGESTSTSSGSISTSPQYDYGGSRPSGPQKRKSSMVAGTGTMTEDEDDAAIGTDGDNKKKKRAKTPRACDSCRRKKIRYAVKEAVLYC